MPDQKDNSGKASCPVCQGSVPRHPEYRIWCANCNWNLQSPNETLKPKNFIEKLQVDLGQTYSQQLFDSVLNSPPEILKPYLSRNILLAFMIATGVYLVALFFLGAGVYILWYYHNNFLAVIAALLCFAFASFVRPVLGTYPSSLVSRKDMPNLYQLVDTISDLLNCSRVSGIVLDHEFGASYQEVGLKGRKILTLGVPFLAILEKEQWIALIAHELAHGVNGDPQRRQFLVTAINTLSSWHLALHPGRIASREEGLAGIIGIPLKLFYFALAFIAQTVAILLVNLLWRDSQKAEYLADYLAATISGTQGCTKLLRALRYSAAYVSTAHQITLGNPDRDFFSEFHQRIKQFPEHEIERLNRLDQMPSSRFDTTHPPAVFRRDFLNAHPVEVPKLKLSQSEFESIQQEVRMLYPAIQKALMDSFRSSAHNG